MGKWYRELWLQQAKRTSGTGSGVVLGYRYFVFRKGGVQKTVKSYSNKIKWIRKINSKGQK